MIHRIVIWVSFLLLFAKADGLVITELHRDPLGRESEMPGGLSHEYIEITNLSSDTLLIQSLFLTDGMDSDSIIPFGVFEAHNNCPADRRFLAPGEIALILDPDYRRATLSNPSALYSIPSGTVLLTVGDGDLGNGLASDDGVIIYKGSLNRIDSVLASACDNESSSSSPTTGKLSLLSPANVPEGISVVAQSSLQNPVSYTVCSANTSPGLCETLSEGCILEYKLSIKGDSAECKVYGLFVDGHASNSQWSLYSCRSGSKVLLWQGSLSDDAFSMTFDLPLDSAQYMFELKRNGILINRALDISQVWVPQKSILVTEIFPRSTADQPEWFEIYNASQMEINLKNWSYGNSEDADFITEGDLRIGPGRYLVICKNISIMKLQLQNASVQQPSRWHSLDNYNDTILLLSPSGQTVDEVCYHSSWFDNWKNQSLEKVKADRSGTARESWVLCTSPTPGLPGKAYSYRSAVSPFVEIGPVPFTPDGDGHNDFLSIRLNIPADQNVKIRIFGFDGREVWNKSSVQAVLFWDGVGLDGRKCAPGPFFVICEFSSDRNRTVIRKRGILWR